MAGIRMAPTANVVATLEPATAAKIMQVMTQLTASPPCIPPTTLLAKSTMRSEIPPASIRLPAKMKNGTATSGYLSRAAYICWAMTSHVILPSQPTPIMLASPMDTATGTVRVKNNSIDKTSNCDMVAPEKLKAQQRTRKKGCRQKRLDNGFINNGLARPLGPKRNDPNDGQRGPNRNRHIHPRYGDFKAGHSLEPGAHRHLCTYPTQKAQKAD